MLGCGGLRTVRERPVCAVLLYPCDRYGIRRAEHLRWRDPYGGTSGRVVCDEARWLRVVLGRGSTRPTRRRFDDAENRCAGADAPVSLSVDAIRGDCSEVRFCTREHFATAAHARSLVSCAARSVSLAFGALTRVPSQTLVALESLGPRQFNRHGRALPRRARTWASIGRDKARLDAVVGDAAQGCPPPLAARMGPCIRGSAPPNCGPDNAALSSIGDLPGQNPRGIRAARRLQ